MFRKERKFNLALPHTYRLTLCVKSESGVGKINKPPQLSHGFLASAGTSAQVPYAWASQLIGE